MKERKIAIIILILLAGLYLAGLGGRMFFSVQSGNSPAEIQRKVEAGEFDPAREFPLLAKMGELSRFFASGLKPEAGEGMLPGKECRLLDGEVVLSRSRPRCILNADPKTTRIGPAKDDIEQVVLQLNSRSQAVVYRLDDDSRTVNDEVYRLCKLAGNDTPPTPIIFILYQQKNGEGEGKCKRIPDPSKPITVAMDNYSPLIMICRGCTNLPRKKIRISFK